MKNDIRVELEKALDLNIGQAEWWVKELFNKRVIKRTSKEAPKKLAKASSDL